MDNKKIGLFIATLRKDKNMTQKDLAGKLFVSDKAVSKWERGLAMPDIGLIEKLAECLNVNVSEILKGEKLDSMTTKTSDEIVKNSMLFLQKKYFKNKTTRIIISLMFFIIIGYFALLCVGEVTNGTLKWKIFDAQYSIDLPSFSANRDRGKAEAFLKAIQNYDYDTIRNILKPNIVSMKTNNLMKEQVSMDEYIINLDMLKKEGFKIIDYRFNHSYSNNHSYIYVFDITISVDNFEHNITAEIQGYGDGVIVDGASIGADIGKIFVY